MAELHMIFENPMQDIVLDHGIGRVKDAVGFRKYPNVVDNINALIAMVQMRPRRLYQSCIVNMSAFFIYDCADFNLVVLSKIFCQGTHVFSPGSQISNDVAQAQWNRGTGLSLNETFAASPPVVNIVDEIFKGKM